MAIASLRAHTDAIKMKLVATTIPVGDAIKPDGCGWSGAPGESLFVPYMVLYPAFGTFDGTIAAGSDDASLEYQITCVGATREQAEWVADEAIAALVEQSVVIVGRSIMRIQLEDIGMVRRDDDVLPSVFFTTPRISLSTTPS